MLCEIGLIAVGRRPECTHEHWMAPSGWNILCKWTIPSASCALHHAGARDHKQSAITYIIISIIFSDRIFCAPHKQIIMINRFFDDFIFAMRMLPTRPSPSTVVGGIFARQLMKTKHLNILLHKCRIIESRQRKTFPTTRANGMQCNGKEWKREEKNVCDLLSLALLCLPWCSTLCRGAFFAHFIFFIHLH